MCVLPRAPGACDGDDDEARQTHYHLGDVDADADARAARRVVPIAFGLWARCEVFIFLIDTPCSNDNLL